MMTRCRISFYILVLLFTALPLSARADGRKKSSYFEFDGMEKTLSLAVGGNTGEGFETYTIMAQPMFQLDSSFLHAYTGVQLNKGSFDFTVGTKLWFWRSPRMRLGPGAVYHFNKYDDISFANDLIFNVNFEARPAFWFGVRTDMGYFYKARTIRVLDNKVLSTHDPAISVQLDFYLPANFTVYARAGSYETFRYQIFCAPSFTAGVTQRPNERLSFTFEATARFIDFFTVSAYRDNNECRIIVGVRL